MFQSEPDGALTLYNLMIAEAIHFAIIKFV